MAKKQLEDEQKALATRGETSIALVPEFDNDGMEDFDNNDIVLPELKVCQGTSPEKNETKRNYIDGLVDGQLFITGVNKVFPKGSTIEFVVAAVQKYGVRREAGTGKFIERVAFDDPRTAFGPNGEKPTADKTYEYYVVLPGQDFPFAVTRLERTKLPVAKNLNLQFKLYGGLSKGKFRLEVVREDGGQATYFNYRITYIGKASPEEYAAAKGLKKMVDSGAAKAAEPSEGEVVGGGAGRTDDDIPF